jgi:plastocyanin
MQRNRFLSNGTQTAAALLLAVVPVLNVGCGDLVSGANYKPTVKYKPSTTGGEAAAAATTAAATTDVATGGVGTIRGKVEFAGNFSPLPPLYQKGGDVKDAAVCAAVEAPNESILVKDGGLANVFIYLRKAPKVTGGAAGDAQVVFDQKNCVFLPHAMLVRVGQTVKVLNSDAVAHNTHTNGVKTTSFNSIVDPNNTVGVPLVYKQAEQEPISVVCDIHSWMRAYHLPIDHPFAAISAADGTFEIKDLPAGKHEFKVWHESGGMLEKSLAVTVNPGDNELTIKVTPSQLGK